jgi:hypothetical protein
MPWKKLLSMKRIEINRFQLIGKIVRIKKNPNYNLITYQEKQQKVRQIPSRFVRLVKAVGSL